MTAVDNYGSRTDSEGFSHSHCVPLGKPYVDAGASATDSFEGDLTAKVAVGGDTVDTSTEGVYTLTYNVSDSAGNAAVEVTRKVTVTQEVMHGPGHYTVGKSELSAEAELPTRTLAMELLTTVMGPPRR